MPTFLTTKSKGYAARTIVNVFKGDITLAFAVDFHSAGEKLTLSECKRQKKPYVGILVNSEYHPDRVKKIVDALNTLEEDEIYLNIAGNGIYTMEKHGFTQEFCNTLVTKYLKDIISHPDFTKKIVTIYSGGQTGFDEAAIFAAHQLSIPATVYSTSNWKFRTSDGKDITDEKLFKERFNYENV